MRSALTAWLAVTLVLHIAAHVSIAAGLVARRSWARALVGFFISPVGALFAWDAGMKWRARIWLATLVAYALGVALA